MFARKGNKEYSIIEAEQEDYIKRGFDIYNQNGELVKSGMDKSVSMKSYEALQKEVNKLKEQNAKLKKQVKDMEEQSTDSKEQVKDSKENSKG